jgi:hypothetical protein
MKSIQLIVSIIIYFCTNNVFGAEIINYQSFFGICFPESNSELFRISLRKFYSKGNEYLVTVDPHTLNTFIEKTSSIIKIEKSTFAGIRNRYTDTKYIKTITVSEKRSGFMQNAGITHIPHIKNGVILTADLCPSRLPIDKLFFTYVTDEFLKIKQPVPIALSVSGLWLENHIDDVNWLRKLEEKSILSITWINHSYNHRFSKDAPLKNNFLLLPQTNICQEIMDTEKKILEAGIVPSVFFRFPGLVSSRDLFLKITGYGLIPVGSDAWLAKDEWPEDGSIILVHANGNEPEGILRLKKFIETKRKNIINKRWNLYDIKESMTEY